MEVEMTIRGLMLDPVTNMPIVILKDTSCRRCGAAHLGGGLRGQRHCAGDGESQHAAADDARSDQECSDRAGDAGAQGCGDGAARGHFLRGDLAGARGRGDQHDSRPSDALALALRVDCPIFVDEVVLKISKQAANMADRLTTEELRKWLEGLNDEDLGKYKM